MVLIGFGCFSNFWASLVVLALVGMSGKGKYLVVTGLFFCQFLDLFCNCSNYPLLFLRIPGISNTPSIISSLKKAHKMVPNLALSYKFSQLYVRPPISSIFPSFPSKKSPVGHNGNEWEIFGFFCFLLILANFWVNLLISYPLSFFWDTRHLQYP